MNARSEEGHANEKGRDAQNEKSAFPRVSFTTKGAFTTKEVPDLSKGTKGISGDKSYKSPKL
jgi:hypothetical protein